MLRNQVKSTRHVLSSLILAILLPLSVAACSTPVKKIEVVSAPLERVPLSLPKIDRVELDDVEWILITPENAEHVWQDLEKKNYDIVLFGLTDRGYESLSVNTAKLKQIVIQQQAVIAAYKRYYEKQEAAIEDQEKKVEQAKEKSNTTDGQEDTLVGRLKGLLK